MKFKLKDNTKVNVQSFEYSNITFFLVKPIYSFKYDKTNFIYHNSLKNASIKNVMSELFDNLKSIKSLKSFYLDYTEIVISVKKEIVLPNNTKSKFKAQQSLWKNSNLFNNFIASLLSSETSIKIQTKYNLTILEMKNILEKEFQEYKTLFDKLYWEKEEDKE